MYFTPIYITNWHTLFLSNLLYFLFDAQEIRSQPLKLTESLAAADLTSFLPKRKPKAKLVLLSSFFILFLLQLQDVALDFKELVW